MSNASRPRRRAALRRWALVIIAGVGPVGLILALATLAARPGAGGGAVAGAPPSPPALAGAPPTASAAPAAPTPALDLTQTTTAWQATTVAAQATETVRRGTAVALATTATADAPLAPAVQAGQGESFADYAPAIDRLLLDSGYYANIIDVGGRRGLRASQRNYSNSFWTRDLDYAISGYSYALGDMALFAENLELFLGFVAPDGVAPETIYLRGGRLDWENRQSWDSMPNLIHAVYVYVAKTGDRGFYAAHRDTLLRVGGWIARLDADGDGLPDQDIFPFGYYDSVENGPLHTYALARFFAAYTELAELEALSGGDEAAWRGRAARLREGFNRPIEDGGYWPEGQPWPIAWRRGDGRVVNVLETFGVFAALRSGLIAPSDPRYPGLMELLHSSLPALLDGPAPLKLTLGGYEPEIRRVVDPPVPLWMLDASAPWVVGLAAPAYAAGGYPADAQAIVEAYIRMVQTTDPPVVEFTAGPGARYGPGDSGDRGRTWDSAAWFMAVYGGHYGLTITPSALVVQPRPYHDRQDGQSAEVSYQGARVWLQLNPGAQTYHLRVDRPIIAVLRPMASRSQLRVDGGPLRVETRLLLEPEHTYVLTSE